MKNNTRDILKFLNSWPNSVDYNAYGKYVIILLFFYFIPLWLRVLDFFQRLRNLILKTLFAWRFLIIKQPRATAVNRSSRASRE